MTLAAAARATLAVAGAAMLAVAPASAEVSEVDPDRPSVANSARTVPPGAFQLETGVEYSRTSAAGVPDERRSLVDALARVGLLPRLELQLGLEPVVHLRGPADETRVGDLTVGLKYRAVDAPPGTAWPTLGLQPFAKLPTADEPIGSGRPDFGLVGLASFALPANLSLDVNVGVAAIGQSRPSGYLVQALTAAALGLEIGGRSASRSTPPSRPRSRAAVPTGPFAPASPSASASDITPAGVLTAALALSGTLGAIVVLLGALAIDVVFGDPRNRWHPVAWIGSAVAWGRTRSAHGGRARLLVAGGVLTLALAGVAAIAAALVTTLARSLGIGGVVIEAVALSALLSVRGLVEAARLVESTLGREDLAAARATVGTHLVSRETAEFDAAQVASAAVESVAENLTDSVLAPICFYLAFGLPGAAVYRVVNTADAMIGYRDDVLEHFGKVAARLDDLLNFVPARLAGIAIVAAAILEGRARHAWRIMRRDARRTASPNAGWPMAAMAGALDVTLEKPATYRLGDGRAPRGEDIGRAVRLIGAATVVGVGAAVLTRIAVALVAG